MTLRLLRPALHAGTGEVPIIREVALRIPWRVLLVSLAGVSAAFVAAAPDRTRPGPCRHARADAARGGGHGVGAQPIACRCPRADRAGAGAGRRGDGLSGSFSFGGHHDCRPGVERGHRAGCRPHRTLPPEVPSPGRCDRSRRQGRRVRLRAAPATDGVPDRPGVRRPPRRARTRFDLTESRRLAADFLQKTEARFEGGTAAKLDVLKAKVDLAAAENALIANQRDISNARASLNRLLGRPLGAGVAVAADSLDVPLELPSLDSLLAAGPGGRGRSWRASEPAGRRARREHAGLAVLDAGPVSRPLEEHLP